ncbi:MAG: hypothetical protein IK116_00295 [Firmicutes bacterium]|nr:hypothetical protein [Bacillota bacterium]
MKKLWAVLAVAVLLLLAACSADKAAADPDWGRYEAAAVERAGLSLAADEVFPGSLSIELMDGARGVFRYDGRWCELSWAYEGGIFHATDGSVSLQGSLSDGVLRLNDFLGSGLDVTLINAETAGNADADEGDTDEDGDAADTNADGSEADTAESDGAEADASGAGE